MVAVGAGVLIAGIAVFQAALALGLPLGEATFGGRTPTQDGVLSPGFRAIAAINGVILILTAGIVLAQAGVIGIGSLNDRVVFWAMWGIVGFLILNTIGNLAAPHPVERRVGGSITLVVAILCGVIALRALA
ncbi:MAG: hypothetical protein WD333_11965 [Dehalococcoidia bacterium]